MSKGKYPPPPKILATSKVFQRGKTQIPKEVREVLQLKDGDNLVWRLDDDGRIFLKRLE